MYNPKFEYKKLSRTEVNGARRYTTPDGYALPSVTTILSATKSQESVQALQQWKKRMGEDRAQQITTEAANRGTRMHSYLEQYIKDGALKERGSNPYSWESHAMAEIVIAQGLTNVSEFWGIEVPLYFPRVYAGTTDGCGIHLNQESILDYKQSNKPKKREWIEDYFLQLVFYGTAHNELYGTDIRKGVIMMCVKPEVDSKFTITQPPQYQEFIIEGEDWKRYEYIMWSRIEQYYLKHQ
jgi:hypothetical protein